MSTSDPSTLIAGGERNQGVAPEFGPGPFSPEVIARLANELFSASPASLDVPTSQATAASSPTGASVPATMPAFQPELELLSDKHFPSLPASAGPTTVAPVTAQYQAGPPAIPGALATASERLSVHPPEFSFLQDVRPFGGGVLPAAPLQLIHAQPQSFSAPVISEFDLKTIDHVQPPSVPTSGISFTSLAKPVSGDSRGFSFIEELRPLNFPAAGYDLPRHDLDRDVPRDLDLSAYPFDAEAIKRDFPILRERVNGRPLVWLDNAATTQKPQSVIDRLAYFYEHENSNVHRAAHELAARATDAYESAREKVRRFVNASSTSEIVFVRGATEGINLIANTWGLRNVGKDDEIVVTWLEHHANIVPWQMLCSATGAKLRVAPVDDSGQVLLHEYEKLLGPRTKLVSFTQVSNALGVVTPAQPMIEIAHRYGAKVLLDGAQSVSHMTTNVQSLNCDFFVFSGHKVFGPTGIGVVYAKPEILEQMPPWQGGGNMIEDVTFEETTFQRPPQRFEAGTGNIADAVGLGAAIDYLDRVGMPNIGAHEHGLLEHATLELARIPGLTIIGTAKEKAGVISFVLDGFRTEEVGSHLNRNGIAVRSGHHCAQPILRRFGLETTVRASFALYNTHEDVDRLVQAVWELRRDHTSIA